MCFTDPVNPFRPYRVQGALLFPEDAPLFHHDPAGGSASKETSRALRVRALQDARDNIGESYARDIIRDILQHAGEEVNDGEPPCCDVQDADSLFRTLVLDEGVPVAVASRLFNAALALIEEA